MAAGERPVDSTALEPPLGGLDDPLQFLRATHQMVRARCDALEEVAANPADPAAARALVPFFATLMKRHLADEEEELFKPLVRVSLKLADTITALRREHEALREQWQALEPLLARPGADPEALRNQASAFVTLKRTHLTREEQLLNQAQHLLSNAQLRTIRSDMLARRGRRG